MNCQKCGKPIAEGSVYCEDCLRLMNMSVPVPEENEGPAEEVPEQKPFEVEQEISAPIVKAAPPVGGADKKKLIAIIAAAAVALLVIIIVIVFAVRGGKPKTPEIETKAGAEAVTRLDPEKFMNEEITDENGSMVSKEELSKIAEATTFFSENVGNQSANTIEEDKIELAPVPTTVANGGDSGNGSSETPANTETTTAKIETVNTADKKQADAAVEEIKAFLNRNCYIDGALYEDGEGSPMSISFHGDDYEVMTNIDGIEVSILRSGDTIYLKRPGTKTYVELTQSVLDFIGLTADDLTVDFGNKSYDDATPYAIYDATVNGKKGVCYVYGSGTGYSKFYSVDGKLVQINICDADQNVLTEMMISTFSKTIPSDQLTVKGYTKTSIGSMLADVGAGMAD